MNSSKIDGAELLAPVAASKVRAFLCEIANAGDTENAVKRFRLMFGHFFTAEMPTWSAFLKSKAADLSDEDIEDTFWEAALFSLRDRIRPIWEAPDVAVAEWRVFTTQRHFHNFVPDAQERDTDLFPPRRTHLQQALTYLRRNVDLLRKCGNTDCLAPYFFASRRSQKYCSDACALPAQREAKRRWWQDRGDAWREKRDKTAKRK